MGSAVLVPITLNCLARQRLHPCALAHLYATCLRTPAAVAYHALKGHETYMHQFTDIVSKWNFLSGDTKGSGSVHTKDSGRRSNANMSYSRCVLAGTSSACSWQRICLLCLGPVALAFALVPSLEMLPACFCLRTFRGTVKCGGSRSSPITWSGASAVQHAVPYVTTCQGSFKAPFKVSDTS